MAKCFESWTVLPHEPIEKWASNLWSVSGTMPNGQVQRRMVVAKLSGGRLLIHNAIALDDAGMAELEAWGKPSYLVVPNSFHRQDAKIWKDRYPELKVLCPRAATSKVGKIVPVDGSYDVSLDDEDVRVFHWRGVKEREGGVLVRSGEDAVLVVNDLVLNLEKKSGVGGFLLAPTGTASVPRFARWMMISDRGAFRDHLLEVAKTPGLHRLVVGHGNPMTSDVPRRLETIAAALG